MYKVQLNIALAGIDSAKADVWQGITPCERFQHKFLDIAEEEDIPLELPDAQHFIAIIGTDSVLSLAKIRERLDSVCKSNGDNDTMLIICTDDVAKLTSTELALADDVWHSHDNEDLAKFRFQRLISLIAERKRAWLNDRWLQATINTLPDLIWFKDMVGLHLEVNDAFSAAVNKDKDAVRGKDHYFIWDISREVYEDSDYVCVETEEEVIAARKTCLFDEEVMKADGTLSKLKTYKTPIFDGETMIGTVGIARDVTREHEYLESIHHMACHDQLTGLANRYSLSVFLAETKTNEMTIVYFDLDYFKEVNDTYGHRVGDLGLIMTADVIKAHFPETLNVRIGGDEFLIVFTDGMNMSTIPDRVQLFIDDLISEFQRDSRFQKMSISAGIAEGNIGHGSFDVLLHRADEALYDAKRAGRSRYAISPRENI